jgi:hypothetical protein
VFGGSDRRKACASPVYAVATVEVRTFLFLVSTTEANPPVERNRTSIVPQYTGFFVPRPSSQPRLRFSLHPTLVYITVRRPPPSNVILHRTDVLRSSLRKTSRLPPPSFNTYLSRPNQPLWRTHCIVVWYAFPDAEPGIQATGFPKAASLALPRTSGLSTGWLLRTR